MFQAVIELEDSYEEQMTKLMHDYENAERAFVETVQQSHSTVQVNGAFQRQLVQVCTQFATPLVSACACV